MEPQQIIQETTLPTEESPPQTSPTTSTESTEASPETALTASEQQTIAEETTEEPVVKEPPPPRPPLSKRVLDSLLSSLPAIGNTPIDEQDAVLRYDIEIRTATGKPIRITGRHDFPAILLPESRPEAVDTLNNVLSITVLRPLILRFTSMLASMAVVEPNDQTNDLPQLRGFGGN